MSIQVYNYRQKIRYNYNADGVYTAKICDNVSSIAFSGYKLNSIADQITSIKINENIKQLDDYALSGCGRLQRIQFNDTLLSVGRNCFSGCVNLLSVQLPTTLESIPDCAFDSCSKLTYLYFKGFESDDIVDADYNLTYVGSQILKNSPGCNYLVFPDSVNNFSELNKTALDESNIRHLQFLGIDSNNITELTTSKCLGLAGNCSIYTADDKKYTYMASDNSLTRDNSYTIFGETSIKTGKKNFLTYGSKIYFFTEELFKWCIDPTTQDAKKFPQRDCPAIVIYGDFKTSVKSELFLENILKSNNLYGWLKSNMKCYLFVLDRHGDIKSTTANNDLQYYRRYFGEKHANTDFVVVNFVYKDKFNSVTLNEYTLTEFKNVLTRYCGETGFTEFNTEGYDKVLDEPNMETPPTTAPDPQNINAAFEFTGQRFDWYPNNNLITATDWNIQTDPLDFMLVATPDTTYILVCTYDEKQDTDPLAIKQQLFPILQSYSDHAEFYDRCDANNKHFLPNFQTGLKYRYFIFFEFSHGDTELISIDGVVTKTQLWNALSRATASNRILGMFDSCHSGSMFKSKNSQNTESVDIAEYIIKKFERRKLLMNRLFGTSTAAADPYIIMWSSTKSNTYGYYSPTENTVFQSAICQAYSETPNSRYTEIFKLIAEYGEKYDSIHKDYSTPQCKTYGADFSNTKIFY